MKRIFNAIFAGGIVGFVAGLLFAPQKGEATRGKIKEAVEKGKQKFEEVKAEIKKN